MNTFFRICIMICILLIVFNLTWSIVRGWQVFEGMSEEEASNLDTQDWFLTFTGLDSGMAGLWLLVTGVGLAASGFMAWATHSTTPIGIFVFADIFWTSYNGTVNIINIGNWATDTGFILIVTIGMAVLFIAAIIGMLTGSG